MDRLFNINVPFVVDGAPIFESIATSTPNIVQLAALDGCANMIVGWVGKSSDKL